MQLVNLDTLKYKRFFAFGCSFTNYFWPTWADIIGQDIPYYENWGEGGGGNHFIFNSVVEADTRHNFNSDDLIIIMWSSASREDRYNDNKWLHAPINEQEETYGKEWFKKFSTDTRAHLIHNCAYIKATQTLLDNKKCTWANFVMHPIVKLQEGPGIEKYSEIQIREMWYNNWDVLCNNNVDYTLFENADIVELYKDIFKNIQASYECMDTFLKRDYKSVPKIYGPVNAHPTPAQALYFLDMVWPNNNLSDKAREYAMYWDNEIYSNTDWSKPIHIGSIIKRL